MGGVGVASGSPLWVTGSQVPGLSSAAFPGALMEKGWMRNGVASIQTGAYVG